MPQPHPRPLNGAALPISHSQIAGSAARGAGLGALAAEYGGATEAYYRTFGPLCSDARDTWDDVHELCAETRQQAARCPNSWCSWDVRQREAADEAKLRTLKRHLAETAVLLLSDIDRALAPLLAPWTQHGLLHDAALLVLAVDADRLRAVVEEVDQLDPVLVLAALGGATDKLLALWAVCAAAATLTLLVGVAAWYAVSRYSLFLALVDF